MSNSKRSNRRDFLKGKSARDALRAPILSPPRSMGTAEPVEGTSDPGAETQNEFSSQRQAGYLEQYSKNAMACEFEINFNLHQYPQSGDAVAAAFQLIDDLEDQMTVYREHSEVTQINRHAHRQSVTVEPQLFDVLKLAKTIYAETNGAFDMTSGPLTRLWKFDRRSGEIPSDADIDDVLQRVGSSLVQLDETAQTIRFVEPAVEINLGGIGKGHSLDRVARLFLDRGIRDFIIHGGQSSVLAFGSSTEMEETSDGHESKAAHDATDMDRPTDAEPGWQIGLSHPTLPGVRLAEIKLNNQALGTSGTGRQGFFHRGKRYGHIIDPRNGWPPAHLLSTTVIAASAAVADALATAFFVMPLEQIANYCESHPEVGAIIVTPQSKQLAKFGEVQPAPGQLSIHSFNLSDQQMVVASEP